jgi:hypothetical protein
MNKITVIFLFLLLFSCSTQKEEICGNVSGFGYLYKDGQELACPFTLQKMTAVRGWLEWIDLEDAVTVLAYDVDDYFPLKRRNSPYTYGIKMNGLKEYFTGEQYTVSLWAADKNRKACGESREFVFRHVEETTDSVIYHTVLKENYERSSEEKLLFFGQREMPSYDWYHVLKVCGDGFILMGEVKEYE